MKFFPALMIIFLSQFCFSQEHSHLFQPEVMKKNKVVKVLEYHPEDSLTFFKKYPEGFYSKYDKEGRIIESNNYSSYETKEGMWIPNMFRNYYIYDTLGKRIAFISKYEDSAYDQPFRYIDITSPRINGDSMDMVTLTREYKPEFRFTTEPVNQKKAFFGDTIVIGKRHKRLIAIQDSSIYTDFYFNKQKLIDSVVFHGSGYGQNGMYSTQSIYLYTYFKNGEIEKIFQKKYHRVNGSMKLYSVENYFFLENGLPDMITLYFSDAENKGTTSKFRYTFRKE